MGGLVLKIMRGDFEPLSAAYLGDEFCALVSSMLEINPDRRPSMREIADSPIVRTARQRTVERTRNNVIAATSTPTGPNILSLALSGNSRRNCTSDSSGLTVVRDSLYHGFTVESPPGCTTITGTLLPSPHSSIGANNNSTYPQGPGLLDETASNSTYFSTYAQSTALAFLGGCQLRPPPPLNSASEASTLQVQSDEISSPCRASRSNARQHTSHTSRTGSTEAISPITLQPANDGANSDSADVHCGNRDSRAPVATRPRGGLERLELPQNVVEGVVLGACVVHPHHYASDTLGSVSMMQAFATSEQQRRDIFYGGRWAADESGDGNGRMLLRHAAVREHAVEGLRALGLKTAAQMSHPRFDVELAPSGAPKQVTTCIHEKTAVPPIFTTTYAAVHVPGAFQLFLDAQTPTR